MNVQALRKITSIRRDQTVVPRPESGITSLDKIQHTVKKRGRPEYLAGKVGPAMRLPDREDHKETQGTLP